MRYLLFAISMFFFSGQVMSQSELEELKKQNQLLMEQNKLLMEQLNKLQGASNASASQPSAQGFQPGLLLYPLDEYGAQLNQGAPAILDKLSPPFAYNAHIKANKRYANMDIGGLYWQGYLNLEKTGEYLFRLQNKVDLSRNGNWRLNCASQAIIDDIQVGRGERVKYFRMTGKNFESEETGAIQVAQSGLRKFSFSIRCENASRYEFTPKLYQDIQTRLQMLMPDETDFRPIPRSAFFYK